MADRLYNAQIDYPFVASSAADAISGVLDVLLYLAPEDPVLNPGAVTEPAGLDDVGAWLEDRGQIAGGTVDWVYKFIVKVPNEPRDVEIGQEFPAVTYRYIEKVFTFLVDPDLGIISVRSSSDSRSVMTVKTALITGAPVYGLTDSIVEPATVVPCIRLVEQINLYNEFRHHNPAKRVDLPPDRLIQEIPKGSDLVLNDGYNCVVSYDEATETLRFTGGAGFGKGRPDTIPWDDTDEDFESGVRSINGVNVDGTVPIESGGGIILDNSVVGILRLIVRDQRDT